jgi:hypothetical protein
MPKKQPLALPVDKTDAGPASNQSGLLQHPDQPATIRLLFSEDELMAIVEFAEGNYANARRLFRFLAALQPPGRRGSYQ